MNRFTITITGESGSGLLSIGEIIIRTMKNLRFFVHAERDYPSLIKGGHSRFQVNISSKPIRSLSSETDILLALDKTGITAYLDEVKNNGILIHGYERQDSMKDEFNKIAEKKIKTFYLPARTIVKNEGGTELLTNTILLGMLWKVLNLDLKVLEKEVEKKFSKKKNFLDLNLKFLGIGFNQTEITKTDIPFNLKKEKRNEKTLIMDGNTGVALGAIQSGVRNYYAYPMSPSSSILTYLARTAHETGMVVKQAEDEITAAQMALGSMYMGSRALVATSGGGYDLMTETVSLSGMVEIPLIIVIGQRPGPATGLPTWTAQADLNMAIYSSHGEFPKIVIGLSDPYSAFELTQHAFNLGDKFQTPIIILSEKTICEAQATVPYFELNKIPIERHLVTDKKELANLRAEDRFALTKTGISKRWIPGSSEVTYFANGDEHNIDGVLAEDGPTVKLMQEKRLRKNEEILKDLPEPILLGEKKADISFIGWGSSKGIMQDIIAYYKEKKIKVNYLHYEYVWPLKTTLLKKFISENKNLHLIEGNFQGQLGELIRREVPLEFKGKFLKYDGRPFYFEEGVNYVEEHI